MAVETMEFKTEGKEPLNLMSGATKIIRKGWSRSPESHEGKRTR